MNKITPLVQADLNNIANELSPGCNLTKQIIFCLYRRYGWKLVDDYIETFNKPVTLTTNFSKLCKGVLSWCIPTYSRIKNIWKNTNL